MPVSKNEELVTTTVSLPRGMMETFREMAKLLGTSQSQLTRDAIEAQMQKIYAGEDYQSKVQEYLAAQAAALTGSSN